MNIRLLVRYRHVPIVPRLYTRPFTSCTILRQQHHEPTNKFEILLGQILNDPNAVRDSFLKLRDMYGNQRFDEKVTELVHDHFKDSPYNLSIFQCLIKSPYLTENVNKHLSSLLSKREASDSEKFESAIAYLTTLNKIIPPNQFDHKIKLSSRVERSLLKVTPRQYYKELFLLVLNLNCDIRNGSQLSRLVYELRNGRADDFYTFLNARLPTDEPKNDPLLLMKKTYTYSMFASVLRIYSRANNTSDFSKVISLMFQKIEEDDQTRIPRNLLVSRAYEHLMSHVLGKYNLKPSLLILQDMQNNGVPISNRMLMIILNRLVNDSDLKNFATLTNYILRLHQMHGQQLNHTTVQVINNQMLKVIQRSKYSHTDLKVIVGYTLAFFKESKPLLHQLGISTLVYDNNTDPSSLTADISNQLQALKYPPMTSLEQVYIALFRYMNFNKTMTLTRLRELYVKYRDTVIEAQQLERADKKSCMHHPFSCENLNDKILKLFMRQLMFRFTSFEGAAELLEDFTKNVHFKYLPNPYMYDLIIKYYLKKNDPFNAFKWFDKLTNEYDVEINYGTLVQLIYKSYEMNSENSKSISRRLIEDHLCPLVRANVFKLNLSKQLKSIINDLELMHLFDIKLLDEKPEMTSDQMKVSNEFNFEEEFDDALIESCTVENMPYVDEMIENGSNTDQDTTTTTTTVPKKIIKNALPFEVEEKDDDQIFEISDMENKNDSTELLPKIREVPEAIYNESLDEKFHPPIVDSNEKAAVVLDTNEVISEISKMSDPSYESTVRQDDNLFKKRKKFLQMLQDATNDDLMILLMNFFKRCEDRIIFYRTNADYKNFFFTQSRREFKE